MVSLLTSIYIGRWDSKENGVLCGGLYKVPFLSRNESFLVKVVSSCNLIFSHLVYLDSRKEIISWKFIRA